MRILMAATLLALVLAPAPAPAATQDDGWFVRENDSETFTIALPPGFEDEKAVSPNRYLTVIYPDKDPWHKMRVKVNGFPFEKDVSGDWFYSFAQKDIGGTLEQLDDRERFVSRMSYQGVDFVSYVLVRMAGPKLGYYVEIQARAKLWDSQRELLDRILDSFTLAAAPEDFHTVPTGWRELKHAWFAILGPAKSVTDEKLREAHERRMYQIMNAWVEEPMTLFRQFANDKRKLLARNVIRVYPTREEFFEAAGDLAGPTDRVVYLPADPEHAIVVDGSPDTGETPRDRLLDQEDFIAPLGVQYVESRYGPLPPWMRAAFHEYWRGAWRLQVPGAPPLDRMEKAKNLFRKRPAKFDDLRAMDEAAFAALGDDGVTVAWAHLQFLLHGGEYRARMEDVLQQSRDTKDMAAAFDEKFEKVKGRDLDKGTRSYIKDYE